MNLYNIFENGIGTFCGALFALLSSIILISINSYIKYKINIKTMLLNVKENNTKINKIKNILCSTDKDGPMKYKDLFEKCNFDIQLCSVDDLWLETKSELYYHKVTGKAIVTKQGESTTLYNLLYDTINFQSLFIKLLKDPPTKDDGSISKIIEKEDINEFIVIFSQYDSKYRQLNLNENSSKFINNIFSYIFQNNKNR